MIMETKNVKAKGLINLKLELSDDMIKRIYARAQKDALSFDEVVNNALRCYFKSNVGGFIKPRNCNK